jgi:hypothetical protein
MGHPDGIAHPMYVQVAQRAVYDGVSLTLIDLAPATLFVGEQPVTSLGHVPTGLFLDNWYADTSGSGTRAIPAVLALLDAERAPDGNARVLLSLPRIRDAGLEYQVRVVEGDIPPTAGACVLFIRPLVPPTTPSRSRSSPLHNDPSSTAA